MTCQCNAEAAQDGTVWGTGVYSDDCRLCRAARHLGAIPAEGGVVTIIPARGLPHYVGTIANGVATEHYGEWGASFTFRP